jgi:hypothetical protein
MSEITTHANRAAGLLDKATDTLLEAELSTYGRPPTEHRRAAAMRDVAQAQTHATLAIGEELRGVRADVADLAAAVRELADAICSQQPRRRWWSRRTENSR